MAEPGAERWSIAVLGSCNMDLVAYVRTAPRRGETVLGERFLTVPGGKGANQAIAAARAGGPVRMIGAVGDDDFGMRVRATLGAAGVDTAAVRTVPGPTGTAHIVVDESGGNSIVVIPSANATVTTLSDADRRLITGSAALLMQLELPPAVVAEGAAVARAAGVRVVLTPAPVQPLDDALWDCVDLLVPNEHEAAALTGVDDPAAAVPLLLERVPEVVVTLGARGCLHARRGQRPVVVPAFPIEPVDTTAAGDTFVGALTVALVEGAEPRAALVFASAAAALSARRAGASSSMPDRAEIDRLAATAPPD